MKKIIVEHLKYRYPQSTELALNDISFEAEEGEKIGFIGCNGSGKSTLCQALTGLVPHFYRGAYGGHVTVDGMEVMSSSISEIAVKVGIVFQNPFTQVTGAKETVYDEVAFGLENLGLPRGEIITRADAALKLLRIDRFKDQAPFSLSGGQMQRMAIAGMIAMRPRIIVLDEPTSQLDPQGSDEVYQALDDLSAQGLTVVLTEHKIEKVARYCDKILILQNGRSMAFDTPAQLFSAKNTEAWGVRPPVYTRVCRELLRPPAGVYPVTLAEAGEALANWEVIL
ncbi:MAG: energy-coupling factor ABC transporter ATP-binding protein [Clostridiales bacterium]|nr:energy-coupling factor ABC transporter ATP-binding protein [Clostridiales bacterium]